MSSARTSSSWNPVDLAEWARFRLNEKITVMTLRR